MLATFWEGVAGDVLLHMSAWARNVGFRGCHDGCKLGRRYATADHLTSYYRPDNSQDRDIRNGHDGTSDQRVEDAKRKVSEFKTNRAWLSKPLS